MTRNQLAGAILQGVANHKRGVLSRPTIDALLHEANVLAIGEIAVALRQPQAKLINLLRARAVDQAEAEAAADELLLLETQPLWGAF